MALQLGAKYVDAFGINNLDLQLEMNRVRPFTHSHNDSISNYTHYNQPLAHPLEPISRRSARHPAIPAISQMEPVCRAFITTRA